MQWIDNVLIGILDYYSSNNPWDILNDIDITIVKVDWLNSILQGKNCIYIMELNSIFIRDDLRYKSELFYLGHELGHIVLHYDKHNIRYPNNGKIERQANYFAFKLMNLSIDEVELYDMTLEQIASTLELPMEPLKQLVDL